MHNGPFALVPLEAWRSYQELGKDAAGRDIERILARDEHFVIYVTRETWSSWGRRKTALSDSRVEGEHGARAHLAEINVLVAKVHALAPWRATNRKALNLQLIGAYELALRNRVPESTVILQSVLDQLLAKHSAKGQLYYLMANIIGCMITWCGFAFWYFTPNHADVGAWVLAGSLGAAGGVLSVASNLTKININVHQSWALQSFAGWTRGVVAFLGGVVCLLAIRGKIALGLAMQNTDPALAGLLSVPEMFFCFLAGFSESLVPNILRDAEAEAAAKAKTADREAGKPEMAVVPGSPANGTGSSADTPPPENGAGGEAAAELQPPPGADVLAEAARLLKTARDDGAFLDEAATADVQFGPERDRMRDTLATIESATETAQKSLRAALVGADGLEPDVDTRAHAIAAARRELDAVAPLVGELAASRQRIAERSAKG